MANVHFHIDRAKLERLAYSSEGALELVDEAGRRVAENANALGSGYRTPKWHDHATGETKGGTQPMYGSTPKMTSKGARCAVHPKNYAAMKDNVLHNTLLKSL
jgi:hypothetical protein